MQCNTTATLGCNINVFKSHIYIYIYIYVVLVQYHIIILVVQHLAMIHFIVWLQYQWCIIFHYFFREIMFTKNFVKLISQKQLGASLSKREPMALTLRQWDLTPLVMYSSIHKQWNASSLCNLLESLLSHGCTAQIYILFKYT